MPRRPRFCSQCPHRSRGYLAILQGINDLLKKHDMPAAWLWRIGVLAGGLLIGIHQSANQDLQDWNTKYLSGLAERLDRVSKILGE